MLVFEALKVAGKLMLTMMHPEMLFVAHVHQPTVASPAVRVDDVSRAT